MAKKERAYATTDPSRWEIPYDKYNQYKDSLKSDKNLAFDLMFPKVNFKRSSNR
jgi:hypothetical protein